jgi:hypothetical protein
MFRKTHIIGFAIVVVALALMAPIAFANDGLVDDWFRDAKPAPQASIGVIDVTAQDVSRPLASLALSAGISTRLVDDWFRDAKPAPQASVGLIDVTAPEVSRPLGTTQVAAPLVVAGTGAAGNAFAWGDFGLGAVAMLGAVALLGLGALVVRHRGGQLSTS